MTAPDDDLALEAELRAAAAIIDPVPPRLRQSVVDAFDLRRLDAELAELVFDSSLELAALRGDQEPRLLTFQLGGLVVEVELSGADRIRRLVGHLVPTGPQSIELRSPQGARDVPVDSLGRFSTDLVPGPFSLACWWPSQLVITDWVTG